MIGLTGITCLDAESDAFREACIKLVQRSLVRLMVARVMVDLGIEPGPTAIEVVALDLMPRLVWSVDGAGRPTFSTLGVGLEDFVKLTVRVEHAGLLEPDRT